MKYPLTWKGKNNVEMGLKIISLPPIQTGTERNEKIEILERDGTLTQLNGYTSDEKSVEADYRGNNPVKLAEWLTREGNVIFGNQEDRYFKARINNVVPISMVLENQLYNFPIKFECQPHAYLFEGDDLLEIDNNSVLYNSRSTYKSLPIITIYGTGKCVLTVNNKVFRITNIPNGYITIDSEIEECYDNPDNNIGEYFESTSFPVLEVGENNISWTGEGITKVEILPKWRAL